MKIGDLPDLLHKLAPLPADGGQRCLLLWWGSLRNMEATVGDCMAVGNVALGLRRSGIPVEIAAFRDLDLPGIPTVHPAAANPRRYRAVCFVCGPLRAKRKVLDLLKQYRKCARIAAGVSILEGESAVLSEFDEVVARDGMTPSYFDLALADPWEELFPAPPANPTAIATCFRGRQGSIGANGHVLHEQAEAALNDAAQVLAGGSAIERIDTVAADHPGIASVLGKFADAKLVLTTRLHGSLMALKFGIPFVAVDQIAGGHKVTETLAKVKWPFVFAAETVKSAELIEAARNAADPSFAATLKQCGDAARGAANMSLTRTCLAVQKCF